MSSNKNKIIFLSLVFIGLLFSVLSVSAAELKYQFPCSPIAGGTCPTAEQTAQSPAAYIARFYQFALMISGALAFAMIIFGAIQYIVSAGNATTQKDAADRIFQALWGVALLFGAYLILYTIDPKLVSLKDPSITNIVIPIETPQGFIKTASGTYETVESTNRVGGIQYQWAKNCSALGEGWGYIDSWNCEDLYGAKDISQWTCCYITQ